MSQGQLQSLRQYISALETQNKCKSHQQTILHRELEALQQELSHMEKYYFQNRALVQEVEYLKKEVQRKYQECEQLGMKVRDMSPKTAESVASEDSFEHQQRQLETVRQELAASLEREDNLRELLDVEIIKRKEQKNYFQDLKQQIIDKEDELIQVKEQLQNIIQKSSERGSINNHQLDRLLDDYERLEKVLLQRQDKIREMEKQIDQLEYHNEMATNNLNAKEVQIKQLRIELKFLQKQNKFQTSQTPVGRFSRSISSTTPKIKECSTTSMVDYNPRQGNTSFMNAPSEQLERSQCSSITSEEAASRLQMRNTILRRQNELLMKALNK